MPGEALKMGGVMFRARGELYFLPASIAIKVMPTPEMAHVPGGPAELRGVALVDGDMIPVVELGEEVSRSRAGTVESARAMLVCVVLGERVGFVGIEVVATGRFEVDGVTGELKLGDEVARPFDVAGVIARVREGRWAV
jgi:chemotaxis signal transduction protein